MNQRRTLLTIVGSWLLLVTANAGLARAQPVAPAPVDVLAALDGRWEGAGVILGQPSRVQMEWARTLADRFSRLTFVSHIGREPQAQRFEGHAYYRASDSGRYRATWFDSSGLVRPIVATSTGSTLVAAWGTPDTEEGETTYRLMAADTLEVVDRVKAKDGTWREFGRSTLSAYTTPTMIEPSDDLGPRPFTFTGEGAEYFRIWIVNLLLSVVTLGIYSAWAKVRRLRYFYGHTALDGQNFGYHASPLSILKGRLVAYAVVFVLAVLGQAAPIVASALYLPLLVLMPIVLVRAFRFRAANSSYGGIRFGFDGTEAEAYRVFLFLNLLLPVTLGLAYPYVAKRQREYFVSESRHGRSQFGLELPATGVYRIYVLAALAILVWFALAAATFVGAAVGEGLRDPDVIPATRVVVAVMLLYAGIGLTTVAVRTAFENLVWNHTLLDRHRFESRLRARRMFWLYLTNLLGIACTLGLFVPWARVRMARYRADSLALLPGAPLVSASLAGGLDAAATGAELSDAMDLDFGL